MADNNAQQPKNQPANPTPAGEGVFVMPEKYAAAPAKKSGPATTLIIIVLLAVIAVTGGYLLYDMMAAPKTQTVVSTTTPPVIVLEQETSTAAIATTTAETSTTTATTTAETGAATSTAAMTASLDSDADGLTDIEETILGTLPTNPDTDGDGYKDGAEVNSNYSPTKAGSAKLEESPFVVKADGSFTDVYFQFLMPKDWQSSTIAANDQVLVSASTGEIIKISVADNRDQMTILGWYLRDHPEVSVSQLKQLTTFDGALTGIYAPDGLTAWLTDAARGQLYTVEYLTGRQTEFRYPGLFNMIIKSLTTALNAEAAETSGSPVSADVEATS